MQTLFDIYWDNNKQKQRPNFDDVRTKCSCWMGSIYIIYTNTKQHICDLRKAHSTLRKNDFQGRPEDKVVSKNFLREMI